MSIRFWIRWTHGQRMATLRWLAFTVVLGTCPVIFAVLTRFAGTEDKGKVPHPVAHGDLYLVSSILAFTALGELIGKNSTDDKRGYVIIIGAGALFLGLIAAYLFSQVSTAGTANSRFVEWSSGIFWVLSALCGVACALVGERE